MYYFLSLYAACAFFLGVFYSVKKKNAFGVTHWFLPLGIFVWGDALVFGLFWFCSSFLFFKMQSQWFTLFFVSCFWLIRSLGEMVYWLNQQFSKMIRDPAEQHVLFPLVKNESVWFLHQIIWQCIAVFSLVLGVWSGWMWLQV